MKAEWDGALENYCKVLSSMRQIVKAREERKDKPVEALTQLRLFLEERRKVAALAQVADFVELQRRVTELEKR